MPRATFFRSIRAAVILVFAVSAPVMAQPDVIVGDITGPSNHSPASGMDAFSLGTDSCNIGNQVLSWISSTNQHPVIGGTLYRYWNGRFQQVGQSWLKHGFTALQGSLCQSCTPHPNGTALGVGCSDPYSSGLNGQQSPLGPRYQVNASTGSFPYPPANPSWSGSVARRLAVPLTLLDAPGAQWVSEAQYIHPEDAAASNDNNNASYRFSAVTGGPTNYTLSFTSPTVREEPAINGWGALDPGVLLQTIEVTGVDGGQFTLGVTRTPLSGGMWHFEYAVHNLNCHDGAGSFSVDFGSGVTIANPGFSSVGYLWGETFNNNPWVVSTAPNGVTWMVDQTFGQNPTSNALRWATTYNFWFDSSDPDPMGASLGLYRSGGTESFPAPSFPTPSWQVNQVNATMDIDGLTNGGFVGPIVANLASGSPHTWNLGAIDGTFYETWIALAPGLPSAWVSPAGQIINLDYTHPTWQPLVGAPGTGIMPTGGWSVPFFAPPGNLSVSGQMYALDPTNPDLFSLSALSEITVAPTPRVVVEAVGNNSFNSNATTGFWRVTHYGTTPADVTGVTLDFTQATGTAAGDYFDTDQTGMNGLFNQGQTYRNNSAASAGLDYSVSSPYVGSGFIATNPTGGPGEFRTVEFQYTGGLFNGRTFEFDADTDPGTQTAVTSSGLFIEVTLSDGTIFTGNLQVDTQTPNRSFVEFF